MIELGLTAAVSAVAGRDAGETPLVLVPAAWDAAGALCWAACGSGWPPAPEWAPVELASAAAPAAVEACRSPGIVGVERSPVEAPAPVTGVFEAAPLGAWAPEVADEVVLPWTVVFTISGASVAAPGLDPLGSLGLVAAPGGTPGFCAPVDSELAAPSPEVGEGWAAVAAAVPSAGVASSACGLVDVCSVLAGAPGVVEVVDPSG